MNAAKPTPASHDDQPALAPDAEPPILCTTQGGVFHIELNRPATRNPLGADTVDALSQAVAQAGAQDEVRVILITARGQAFSAGGNLGNLSERLQAAPGLDGQDPIALGNRRYGAFLEQLVNSPKTTVVAVSGAAMGGGAGLVCAADIAIGAVGARFGFPETSIGLVPGQILPFVAARVGVQAARRLMLTGERIDAAEAHRIGLLDHLVASPEDLRARTDSLLAMLTAAAPVASAKTKQMLRGMRSDAAWPAAELQAYLDQASHLFARQMRTEAIEGVAASRAKRAPAWGRPASP